jgi:hypothetical protein
MLNPPPLPPTRQRQFPHRWAGFQKQFRLWPDIRHKAFHEKLPAMSGSFFVERGPAMSQLHLSGEFAMNGRALRSFRWTRVFLGGVAAELAVFAIVFPVLRFFGQTAFLVSILAASAAMPFLFALWVNKRVESNFMLHGLLVGAVAALFYLILARGQPEPLLYKIAHGLKLAGGLLGGLASALRRAGRVAHI